jgi:hypothetical protein
MITEVVQEQEVQFPELDELQQKGALVLREQFAIEKIQNDEHYTRICQLVLDAAANVKLMTEHVREKKEAAYAHWKKICSTLSEKLAPWEAIREKGDPLIAAYQAEKERLRKIEEEGERQRQMEVARQANEIQADQLDREGRTEEAVAILDSQPIVPVAVVSRSTPKVAGIGGTKSVYSCEVVNLKELVDAISTGKAPIQCVEAATKFLDGQASLFKESFSLPGCRLKKETKLTGVRTK